MTPRSACSIATTRPPATRLLLLLAAVVALATAACRNNDEYPTAWHEPGGRARNTIYPTGGAPFGVNIGSFYGSTGLNVPPYQVASLLDSLASAGVSWVRMSGQWPQIEDPVTGVFSDSMFWELDSLHSHGFSVMMNLVGTPSNHKQGLDALNNPPPDSAGWDRFVTHMVDLYWTQHPYVRYWEIWNEPQEQLSEPFSESTYVGQQAAIADYVTLVRIAARIIHARNAYVIGGALSNDGQDSAWMQGIANAGVADVYSYHSYAWTTREMEGYSSRVNNAVSSSPYPKPIWITEFNNGDPEHTDSLAPDATAAMLSELAEHQRFPLIQKAFIHSSHHYPASLFGQSTVGFPDQASLPTYRQFALGCSDDPSTPYCMGISQWARWGDELYTTDAGDPATSDAEATGTRVKYKEYFTTSVGSAVDVINLYRCGIHGTNIPNPPEHVVISDWDGYDCGTHGGVIEQWMGWIATQPQPGMAELFRLENTALSDFVATVDTQVVNNDLANGWTRFAPSVHLYVWPGPSANNYQPHAAWWASGGGGGGCGGGICFTRALGGVQSMNPVARVQSSRGVTKWKRKP